MIGRGKQQSLTPVHQYATKCYSSGRKAAYIEYATSSEAYFQDRHAGQTHLLVNGPAGWSSMALIRGLFFTNSTAITRALRAGTTLSPISDACTVRCATCLTRPTREADDEGRSLPLMMMRRRRRGARGGGRKHLAKEKCLHMRWWEGWKAVSLAMLRVLGMHTGLCGVV